jgi:hypothetical protein
MKDEDLIILLAVVAGLYFYTKSQSSSGALGTTGIKPGPVNGGKSPSLGAALGQVACVGGGAALGGPFGFAVGSALSPACGAIGAGIQGGVNTIARGVEVGVKDIAHGAAFATGKAVQAIGFGYHVVSPVVEAAAAPIVYPVKAALSGAKDIVTGSSKVAVKAEKAINNAIRGTVNTATHAVSSVGSSIAHGIASLF